MFDLMEFLKKPSIVETFVDILLCAVPIWLAVMIGLVIGWSWRPRWTGLIFLGLRSKFRFLWTAPPGFGARRLWLAFTALSAFSVCRTIWSNFYGRQRKGSTSPTTSTLSNQGDSDAVGSVFFFFFKVHFRLCYGYLVIKASLIFCFDKDINFVISDIMS